MREVGRTVLMWELRAFLTLAHTWLRHNGMMWVMFSRMKMKLGLLLWRVSAPPEQAPVRSDVEHEVCKAVSPEAVRYEMSKEIGLI